jgi:hypothetical protein
MIIMNTDFNSSSKDEPETLAFGQMGTSTAALDIDGRSWLEDLYNGRLNNATVRRAEDGVPRQRGRRLIPVLVATLFTSLLYPVHASAADLKSETTQAWQEYVKFAEARNRKHLAQGSPFLSIDADGAESAKLRRGEVLASPSAPNVPLKVPGGLIHDWTGAIFIPMSTIPEILGVTRNYALYSALYHPSVVYARLIENSGWEDRFSIVVMNKTFFAKRALDSDYHSTFTRLDDQRWYSVSETTRVQEVAQFGSPSQHTLAEGQGTGIIWRLCSIARYEECDGGVYIELEAIALSRDIPTALRWVVEPIVRKVSRSSLVTSLEQTAEAVRSSTSFARRAPEDPLFAANCTARTSLNTTTARSFR